MNRFFWIGIEIALGMMALLLVGSWFVIKKGSATYVIWFFAAGHVALAMILIGAFIYFDWDPFRAFFGS